MHVVPVSRLNRFLVIVLGLLYLASLGVFTYLNWRVEGDPHLWGLHALNALILSIPLILFYGSLYVLITAWRQRRQTGRIESHLARTIHLAPRLAAIGIIFFISLFSLDVFDLGGTPLQKAGAFLMHSLPSMAMIGVLVIAWKRPVVGFAAFLLAGLYFLRFVVINGNGLHFLLFSGPLLLISALFYADWRWVPAQNPAAVEVRPDSPV